MTTDELKMRVLLDIANTEDVLDALHAKGSFYGMLLSRLGEALKGNPSNALDPPPWQRDSAQSLLDTAREALAYDDLLVLVNEYVAAAQRLEELNIQRRDLGIRDRPRRAN